MWSFTLMLLKLIYEYRLNTKTSLRETLWVNMKHHACSDVYVLKHDDTILFDLDFIWSSLIQTSVCCLVVWKVVAKYND